MNSTPSTEERIWAVLAHLSTFAFGFGTAMSIIGWSQQRTKSKYAAFQCLQALGYQSIGYTVWVLSYLVLMVLMFLVLIGLSFVSGSSSQVFVPVYGVGMLLLFVVVLGSWAVFFILPLIGAIACGMGREFRYPFMGNRLAHYLGYNQTDEVPVLVPLLIEEYEDRWVAACGHFTVIIALFGIIAPLTAWIMEGKRSPFLKFQSIQTVVYQGFVNLLYMGGSALHLVALLPMAAFSAFDAMREGSGSELSMIGMLLFLALSLIASLILFIIPLFHIFGQWAGYRVLKGQDYRYKLIGRLVERWTTHKAVQSSAPLIEGTESAL